MKRNLYSCCCVLLACFITLDAAVAQQNLFNVPSGQITAPGNLFFQQQFNVASQLGQSSTTFDYGLGNSWEVGVNLTDVQLWNQQTSTRYFEQITPAVLCNVQKGFAVLEDRWKVGLGTQSGLGPNRAGSGIPFEQFAWITNSIQVDESAMLGRYFFGSYYANRAYGGGGDPVGGLLGAEIPIIQDRLYLQADCITGDRSISAAVFGCVALLPNEWQVSIGLQAPTFRSDAPVAAVFEFTHLSLPLFQRFRHSRSSALKHLGTLNPDYWTFP